MASAPKYYWDSCVFLSAINGEPDRLPDIEALMEDASKKKIVLYTSAITITEVAFAHAEKANQILDPQVEKQIDKLWHPESPISLVDFHSKVAFEARSLMRKAVNAEKSGLKAADAIHLATARLQSVAAFHTYDTRLNKYAEVAGLKICEPIPDQLSLASAADAPSQAKEP